MEKKEEKIIVEKKTDPETIIKVSFLLLIVLFSFIVIIAFNYLQLENENKRGIESSNKKIKQLESKVLNYSIYVLDGFITYNALMFEQALVNENSNAMKNFRQNQYITFKLYEDSKINNLLEKYKKCTEDYIEGCIANDLTLNKKLYENMIDRYNILLDINVVSN